MRGLPDVARVPTLQLAPVEGAAVAVAVPHALRIKTSLTRVGLGVRRGVTPLVQVVRPSAVLVVVADVRLSSPPRVGRPQVQAVQTAAHAVPAADRAVVRLVSHVTGLIPAEAVAGRPNGDQQPAVEHGTA